MESRPASIKFPKNFQPKHEFNNVAQTSCAEDPTSRDLEVLEALLLGNEINCCAGWHTPGQSLDTTLFEVRDRIGPVRNYGNGVAGGDKCALSVDHVTVTIAIGGSTKGNAVLLNGVNQAFSISQVGVGVATAEVGGRNTVLGGRIRETEFGDEDGAGVWAGNTVETVEEDAKALGMGEEFLDQGEVKDRFEELDVISNGVNDLNLQRAISGFSNLREVDLDAKSQSKYNQGYVSERTGSSWRTLYSVIVLVFS